MKQEAKELNKLCYLNRQPTLWRHGIPCVEIVPSDDDELVIGLSPLTLEPLNGDFDGDELALYIISDQEALKEMKEKAFIKNNFFYDSDNSMLATVRHESLYACYILTETIEPNFNDFEIIEINNINDLSESFELWNNNLKQPVFFNNTHYTYGVVLLNKWLGFDNILINEVITKRKSNKISKLLYEQDKETFYDKLFEFSNKLFYFISVTNHNPTIDVDEMVNLVNKETEVLFSKLPHNNVVLGYYLNEGLIDRVIENMDKESNLYRLYQSGSRMNKQQLSRSCINVGYVADAKNTIIPSPICTNLMKGLDKVDYFKSGPGARKGKQ